MIARYPWSGICPRNQVISSVSEPVGASPDAVARIAPADQVTVSSGNPDSRILPVLSLDSCTFGWSNGLISSTQPATAVAYSQARNWAPSGPETTATGSGASPTRGPTSTSATSSPLVPGAVE